MQKYIFGSPIENESVVVDVPVFSGKPERLNVEEKDGKVILSMKLEKDAIVYGLGESNRGMNKRGWEYVQKAEDDPNQTEDRRSLYAAHNFIIIADEHPFGIYVDCPGMVRFDIGYSHADEMVITSDPDMKLYIIDGKNPYQIARNFRKIIGRSYIPPKFAFGYGQSRWGYKDKEDFRTVLKKLNENNVPVDMIYMDIDYMQDYKDFTFNEKEFADFPEFVKEMKEQGIHLVPIIDAAIKKQPGFDVYEEGVKNNYFCKLEDGKTDFVGAAWPGYAMFPDFLNDEARAWFGDKYKVLTDAGIDAFWNDMNEPAIFYSEQGLDKLKDFLKGFIEDDRLEVPIFELYNEVGKIKNSQDDYRLFYHNKDGQRIRHDKVHNLYGYYMTRSATEAFDHLRPEERTLMFSRSSYIGMHRYGGIWTGDNASWWSHILLLTKQLPALSMVGFLYSSADMGGFGQDTTEDLVARFSQLGVFTPLFRNHSSAGTREQEPYQFDNVSDLAHIISVRYQLIPYLYSEFMKAALEDDLLFKPLAFEYENDPIAKEVEDQLLLGNEIMIAPVYTQNASGRVVYLPEEMMKVSFKKDGSIDTEILQAGHQYVPYGLDEVVFFIRKGKAIPVAKKAMRTKDIDEEHLGMIGYEGAEYPLYNDDGITKNYSKELKILTK
jgi:alpha-glucosidase